MAYSEADRALAFRHVLEGEERVARQREAIGERRAKGWPIGQAKAALDTMLVTLELMRDHLVQIEADLDKTVR